MATAFAACGLALLPACKRPVVGEAIAAAQTAGGPAVAITTATIDGTGHVVASLTLTNGGAPIATREAALALRPHFTLAALSRHPVDGLAAWKSLVLTGAAIPSLPPGGPGTPPAEVLTGVKQPGAETDGTLAGADGAFTYTFATALPAGFDPAETLRVGVWLLGAGTAEATSTFDFRPAGGAAAPRDTVLEAACAQCHEAVKSPRGAVGVKICLTCHTWQNADPDTGDPAAAYPPDPATDPNPLDFGRFVHRIHRGRQLPTLYQAAAGGSTVPAPALPSATALPLPFSPGRTGGATAANPPVVGRKFSVVGAQGHEHVMARIEERRDNGQPPRVVASGHLFPRDLRDCDACHQGAPQAYEVLYGISRRTCAGCHPETWFQATAITDTAPAVHFAHAGGPQADDTRCRGCHVAAGPGQKLYAPLAEAHLPPYRSARYSRPVVEIVGVEDFRPGAAPRVKLRVYDEVGPLSPPNAPTPDVDPSPYGSPVPRKLERLYIFIAGPTAPDYSGAPITSADAGNPNPLTLVADADGVFTYPFASTIPQSAAGTWTIATEARRRGPTTLYDTATDTFRWPYTGETVSETAQNAVVHVDVAAGAWPGGAPVPRRAVASQAKCERCHDRIALHGGLRNQVAYCVACHIPAKTDWAARPKLNGNVNLAATYDGLEERSIDFKVLVHRIHVGGRSGSAAGLDLIRPHVVYGYGSSPYFLDEGLFPRDLRDCTVCHEGRSYTVDAFPAGALPTVANETATLRHSATSAHAAGEPAIPAAQATCMSCHATGAMLAHVERYPPSGGAESCARCHVRGTVGVDVAHRLAAPDAATVSGTFTSIAETLFVPRCASAACHGGSSPAAFPQVDAEAYGALVGVDSQQVGLKLVQPFAPERSYLLLKLRGEAGSVGGIATPMPIGDAALSPSEIAAVEAWIANGAPND